MRYKIRRGATADTELLEHLRQIKERYPRFGSPRVTALLRSGGHKVNHKRVERLWKAAGFQVAPRKRQWRRAQVVPQEAVPCRAEKPNHVWSYDIIEDALIGGRKLRILNVLDEFTREWLAVKVNTSMSGAAVAATLCPLFEERGVPAFLRSDQGSEFIAAEVKTALATVRVTPAYIEVGSPWQNGFVESFHGKLRDECLDREVFLGIAEARVCLEQHRRFYNEERPHSSVGYLPPAVFRQAWEAKRGKKEDHAMT
jgi:putative transposase